MADKWKALPDGTSSNASFYTAPGYYHPFHVKNRKPASSHAPPTSFSVQDVAESHQDRLSQDIMEVDRCLSATRLFELEEQRRRYMQSLRFRRMEAQHATIKSAHSETCEWLLDRTEYRRWLKPEAFPDHHGLFCIEGKPATGKSTITKFVCESLSRTEENAIVLRFFFNARGEELERTTIGMYRSLLFQLFDKISTLQNLLDSISVAESEEGGPDWSLEPLESLLRSAVSRLDQQAVFCVVDALDECEEDQVREMVGFFERLGQQAVRNSSRFYTWFSSRHYPYISTKSGVRISLEEQEGHDRDIEMYVDSELRIRRTNLAADIKNEILRRASGIFLWVTLVLQILNKEHDHGRVHTMERRLTEIPDKLEGLFDAILMRDGPPGEEQITCLQWVLYARRPLSIQELYFAIIASHEPNFAPAWRRDIVTEDDMTRYILDCSKGLMEITRIEPRTVQFIHESVREYFITGPGLNKAIFAPTETFAARSHEKLKRCCQAYFMKANVLAASSPLPAFSSEEARNICRRAEETFPFILYSVREVLYHSNSAQCLGQSQIGFLNEFPLPRWIQSCNILRPDQVRRTPNNASILYILAELNLAPLILASPQRAGEVNARGGWSIDPLIAAQSMGNREALKALLDLSLTLCNPVFHQSPFCLSEDTKEATTWLIEHKGTFEARDGQSILLQAATHGGVAVAKLLLANKNVNASPIDWLGRTPLFRALERNQIDIVRLFTWRNNMALQVVNGHFLTDSHLLRSDSKGRTPLWYAATSGNISLVKSLLQRFPDHVEFADNKGRTPLCCAARKGHVDVVQELLMKSTASMNRQDNNGDTPLMHSVRSKRVKVIEILVGYSTLKASIANRSDRTPLMAATISGNVDIVRLLASHENAGINLRDCSGATALMHAVEQDRADIAQSRLRLRIEALLSNEIVHVNVKDQNGGTAPMHATKRDRAEVVQSLLAHRDIDVNRSNNLGETPLIRAVVNESLRIVEALLSNEMVNVNAKDENGDTALMHATASGNETIVMSILAHDQVNVGITNNKGKTACDLAKEKLEAHSISADDLEFSKLHKLLKLQQSRYHIVEALCARRHLEFSSPTTFLDNRTYG